jgi:hypothetical protein
VGAPLHFRRFDSGVLVVQSDSHSDEQARAQSALDTPSALLSHFALLNDALALLSHGWEVLGCKVCVQLLVPPCSLKP